MSRLREMMSPSHAFQVRWRQEEREGKRKQKRENEASNCGVFDLEKLMGLRLRAHHQFTRVVPLEINFFATSESGKHTRSRLEKAISATGKFT